MERWLRYTVLPVGQGAGAFVQVWEGQTLFREANATPIEASLIDLGSLGWKRTAGVESARFVADQLKKMKRPAALDAVFLSHSDSDHTNLLKDLFEYFDPPGTVNPSKPALSVGQAWFGGQEADYKKRSIDPLPLLQKYGATLRKIGAGETSWHVQPPRPLHESDKGVVYNLLVGNTLDSGPDVEEEDDDPQHWREASQSFLRNVVSLVLVVQYGQQPLRLVATGDSTGLTLAKCNELIEAHQIPIAPVLTLSLPHHGSETSTFDMNGYHRSGGAVDDAAAREVAKFVANLRPESITASAAERGTYRHPSSRVIAAFAWPTGSGMYREEFFGEQHFFTAHYPQDGLPLTNLQPDPDAVDMEVDTWPPGEGWYTGHTNRNVFTIDYTRDDPRGVDLAAISFATPQDPGTQPKASLGAGSLPANARIPPRAAGWGYYVSSDGTQRRLERLVDVRAVTSQARAMLEAVHGPLPPERFVFIPSAPEPDPAAEQPPPRPAVVPEAPRRRVRSDSTRRPRQLP